MGFFDKKFETVAEILTPEQEQQLMSEIKASDEKRMVFFATVSAVLSIPLIVLDFIYFNQNLQKAYLVFDAALLIYSIIFLILTSLNATRHTVKTLKHLLFSSFPFFILAWATVISVIDQVSILNILAFYVPLFLIMFMLYSSLVRVLVYFIFILSVYFISSQFLERPYSSETFAMIIAGFVATTPFSLHFKRIRKNSNAVHLKLHQINQSLESEVDARTFELKKLNQDLELEIAQRKMAELQLR
jgi:flagellar basal body-associated protein FliL